MTLKEKLEVEIMDLPIMSEVVEDIAKNLEYVADDFAIGFAEWKDRNCYLVMGSESLFYFRNSEIHDDAYTRKELLEIYKLSTGL